MVVEYVELMHECRPLEVGTARMNMLKKQKTYRTKTIKYRK